MFVDGIVLLADTEKGLQELLNGLEELCNNWDLSINIEIDAFNKPTCSSQFFCIHFPSRTSTGILIFRHYAFR